MKPAWSFTRKILERGLDAPPVDLKRPVKSDARVSFANVRLCDGQVVLAVKPLDHIHDAQASIVLNDDDVRSACGFWWWKRHEPDLDGVRGKSQVRSVRTKKYLSMSSKGKQAHSSEPAWPDRDYTALREAPATPGPSESSEHRHVAAKAR